MPSLLLASSSSYRRELLARLRLPFTCRSPDIDESRRPNEAAFDLVQRLAREKAQALAVEHPHHLIIGSDQVAVLDEQVLGKPHSFERALEQLTAASGKSVTFLTGLALLNSSTGECQVDCVPLQCTCANSTGPASNAICMPNSPMTALAASRQKALASACFAAPKAATRPA